MLILFFQVKVIMKKKSRLKCMYVLHDVLMTEESDNPNQTLIDKVIWVGLAFDKKPSNR